MPEVEISVGIFPTHCVASQCNGTAYLWQISAMRSIGWITPVSLLAHWMVTRAVLWCVSSSCSRVSRQTRPSMLMGAVWMEFDAAASPEHADALWAVELVRAECQEVYARG